MLGWAPSQQAQGTFPFRGAEQALTVSCHGLWNVKFCPTQQRILQRPGPILPRLPDSQKCILTGVG